MGYLDERNISWECVFAAFFLALLPRIGASIIGPGSTVYDPQNPRRLITTVKAAVNLSSETRGRIERSENALNNSFENLPLFAIAVLAANVKGLDVFTLNILSLAYLAIRVLYIWVYIWGQEYPSLHPLTRTLIWFVGNFVLGYIYLSPGAPGSGLTPINALKEEYSFWLSKAIRIPKDSVLDPRL
ncbi:hypothetical protein F4804DRAFT_296378 [Jackrogersella minutella]|nr:hypothetical protein F4804DRAFT_296378 [Jackrogersella minutella]